MRAVDTDHLNNGLRDFNGPEDLPVIRSVTSMPLLFKITNFIPISTPSSDPILRMSSRLLRMAATLPLMRVSEPNVDKIDVTRPWRDGGRDAVGDYLLGPDADPVAVEFALEAKCYAPGHGVGVRETSRLISRLRHRQFGVLVTTSHLESQAYKEIREDGHPVIVLAGRDITDILKKSGLDTTTAVDNAKVAPM